MIKVKGRIVTFTGKDLKNLKELAYKYGLSMQDMFTGVLWETIMRKARDGAFVHGNKKTV